MQFEFLRPNLQFWNLEFFFFFFSMNWNIAIHAHFGTKGREDRGKRGESNYFAVKMRVLILWWRRGERRENGGSERQSGMDGKSRDLLAGIKRVFETRAECSHTRWRYLCFDEKVVAFVQPEITLFFSLSLSVHLSAFLYHNMDFSITVLQTVPRDPWIDGSKFL